MWIYDASEKAFEDIMAFLLIGGLAGSYALIIGYILREAWRLIRKRRSASNR